MLRTLVASTLLVTGLSTTGCSPEGAGDGEVPPVGDGDGDGDVNVEPNFDPPANCDPAPAVQEVWDHSIISRAVTALGSPYHGSTDAVTRPGVGVTVRARFVYGLVLKDLEDETVLGYIESGDCQWQPIGDVVTDDDGIATFTIPGSMLSKPGAHNIELAVRGDDSHVRGVVWVVPAGTDAVVFDVDGTMTTGDTELFEEILLGEEPTMYEAADQVVDRYRQAQYLPIFVTGRPTYLDIMTREWLAARGMVAPLELTSGLIEGTLDVEAFKRDTVLDLASRVGLDIRFAYGNASTDICAYAAAGVDPADTYIIGPNRGQACAGFAATSTVLDYPSHLAELDVPARN